MYCTLLIRVRVIAVYVTDVRQFIQSILLIDLLTFVNIGTPLRTNNNDDNDGSEGGYRNNSDQDGNDSSK